MATNEAHHPPGWRTPLIATIVSAALLVADCALILDYAHSTTGPTLGGHALCTLLGISTSSCRSSWDVRLIPTESGYDLMRVRDEYARRHSFSVWVRSETGAQGLWAGEFQREYWELVTRDGPSPHNNPALYAAFYRSAQERGLGTHLPPQLAAGPIDTRTIRWAGIVHDALTLGNLATLVISLRTLRRRVLAARLERAARNDCGSCGYSLDGLSQPHQCPECGARNAA